VSSKQDEVIVDLSCELLGKHEEINEKDDIIETLKTNLDCSLKEKLCAQKMKWYYKKKRGNLNNREIESYSILDFFLKVRIFVCLRMASMLIQFECYMRIIFVLVSALIMLRKLLEHVFKVL